jgi:hypothetical protein
MRTITNETGTGPVHISKFGIRRPKYKRVDSEKTVSVVRHYAAPRFAANDNDEPTEPVERVELVEPVLAIKRKRRWTLDLCGFITNPKPRTSELKPSLLHCERLLLGDPDPTAPVYVNRAANDNGENRWPVREEYIAGRLGPTEAANNAAWEAVDFISKIWTSFLSQEDHSSTFLCKLNVTGSEDIDALFNTEKTIHVYRYLLLVNQRTAGRFVNIVKPAIIDGCEMSYLAPDIRNKAKRPAVGRARFIEALPIVAEEFRLLALADAA